MTDKIDNFINQFDRFIEPGIIAHSQVFEVVEIFGHHARDDVTFNVLTILVASENLVPSEPLYLVERFRVDGIGQVVFGIKKTVVPIIQVREAIDGWRISRTWKPVKKKLHVGELDPLAGSFVPGNWNHNIAFNRVTKNNFFNGSHILELFDRSKVHVKEMLSAPNSLASLSEKVADQLPIEIAGISDRLGNIILQFPVEIIRAKFSTDRSVHSVEVAWHPKSEPRGLLAIGSVYHDQTAVAFGSTNLSSGKEELCADAYVGLFRGYIWDVNNKLLLAATDDGSYIKNVKQYTRLKRPESRTFPVSSTDERKKIDNSVQAQVQLFDPPSITQLGDFNNEKIVEHIQSRIFDEERRTLAKRRTFVQYGAQGQTKIEGRNKALNDLRWLINQHGCDDVWLWDPYLFVPQILESLFWNENSGSNMRALTKQKKDNDTLKKQVKELSEQDKGYFGLDIEFRTTNGQTNWDFHDRFLIFPKSIRATHTQAWSLGTSVNCLGKTHHILQQVDNAQLIASEFEKFWDAMAKPENLIWKYPS